MEILRVVLDICGVFFIIHVSGVIVAYGLLKGSTLLWQKEDGVPYSWDRKSNGKALELSLASWIFVLVHIQESKKEGVSVAFRFTVPRT